MNDLIRLHDNTIVGNHKIQTVDARELHGFLGSKQQYADWIKGRIAKYDFVENQDYVVIHSFLKNLQGGRPTDDYHVSLSMAKELSMVERNEKGKQARLYFIDCETKLKAQFKVPRTFTEALRLAADLAEENELLAHERDHAVATKAHISDKKTATAMGKLGGAMNANRILKEKLGIAENYQQVRAIPWINEYFDVKLKGTYIVVGNALAKLSKECGVAVKRVDHAQYGKVNVYRKDIVRLFCTRVRADGSLHINYRK